MGQLTISRQAYTVLKYGAFAGIGFLNEFAQGYATTREEE